MHRPDDRIEGNRFVAMGAVLAGTGVAAGAFGAHVLRDRLADAALDIWRTAAQYQMYHALAIVVVGRLLTRNPARLLRVGAWLFIIGIAGFSGSLYGLAITGIQRLGLLTPIGGVAFLAGWASLFFAVLRHPRS